MKFQLPSRATNPRDSCGHGAAFSHPRTRHKPCAIHRGSLDRVSSVAGKVVRRTRMIQDRRLQKTEKTLREHCCSTHFLARDTAGDRTQMRIYVWEGVTTQPALHEVWLVGFWGGENGAVERMICGEQAAAVEKGKKKREAHPLSLGDRGPFSSPALSASITLFEYLTWNMLQI